MSRTVAYLRCNSGHYFDGSVCPFDGWTATGCAEFPLAVARLDQRGLAPSRALLAAEGLPDAVLSRILVMEFPDDCAVFEAMNPAGYIVGGRWTPLVNAPPGLR
ncbi:hypothetical protein [Actinoplanes sp. GCM10030250]|uniref:hypothetical protein n=1 Tax=Actinoplanes sp. GCM10030250 TaxID=3273376 RepID=UPI00360A041B